MHLSPSDRVLIVDSSYLTYRSYFAYPGLTWKTKPVGALFGFCKTVLSLIRQFQPNYLVFAFDLPEKTWRHKQLESYKQNRPKPDDAMIEQFPQIEAWCRQISKDCLSASGFEADDMIFTTVIQSFSQFAVAKKESITEGVFDVASSSPDFETTINELTKLKLKDRPEFLIFSADRDLYQLLVFDNVKFIKPQKTNKYEVFTSDNFVEKYQLSPIQWLDFKALVGDSSDNFKGIEGVGPKTATDFLHRYGCLHGFFEKQNMDGSKFLRSSFVCKEDEAGAKVSQKITDKVKENHANLLNTYLLSSLSFVPNTVFSWQKFDLSGGIEIFENLGFTSLVKEVNGLQKPIIEQESLF